MTRELTEITVVGGDKTGLIARVTSLLFERGINIEDSIRRSAGASSG